MLFVLPLSSPDPSSVFRPQSLYLSGYSFMDGEYKGLEKKKSPPLSHLLLSGPPEYFGLSKEGGEEKGREVAPLRVP